MPRLPTFARAAKHLPLAGFLREASLIRCEIQKILKSYQKLCEKLENVPCEFTEEDAARLCHDMIFHSKGFQDFTNLCVEFFKTAGKVVVKLRMQQHNEKKI